MKDKGTKTWLEQIEDVTYVIEPIGNNEYIVGNENGFYEIVKPIQDKQKNYWLKVGNTDIELTAPLENTTYNFRPNLEYLEDLNKGTYNKIKPEKLFNAIYNYAVKYLDLQHEHDYFVLALYVYQTYRIDNLNSSYLLAVDGDKNTGKTSVLEFLNDICYRYALIKDITGAGLMRVIEREGLNIGFDEVDELKEEQKADVFSVLRSAQRRNNNQVRLKNVNNDFVPKKFETFGAHAFSYRGNVEDALESRTLSIQMVRSKDGSLSTISLLRNESLEELRNTLFYFRLNNYIEFYKKQKQFTKENITTTINNDKLLSKSEIKKLRNVDYNNLTKHLNKEIKEYHNNLFGRTAELFLVVVNLSEALNLQLNDLIKKVFEKKVALMDSGHSGLEYAVLQYLINAHTTYSQLKTGANGTNEYRDYASLDDHVKISMRTFKNELRKYLVNEHKMLNINDSQILRTLKSFGFKTGVKSDGANYNISERDGSNQIKKYVIFDKSVKDRILEGVEND